MALALQVRPPPTGLESATSRSRSRKTASAFPHCTARHVHRLLAQSATRRHGILSRPVFGRHSDGVSRATLIRCLAAETDEPSVDVGLGFSMTANSSPFTTRRDDSGLGFLPKLMANLQLLGVLTAIAMGMRVAGPAAVASAAAKPSITTERRLGKPTRQVKESSDEELPDKDFEDFESDDENQRRMAGGGISQSKKNGHKRIESSDEELPDEEFEDFSSDDETRRSTAVGGISQQDQDVGEAPRGAGAADEDELQSDFEGEELQSDFEAEELRSDFEVEELQKKPYEITVPLRIVSLRGSIPPDWLKDFLVSQGKRVKLVTEFKTSLRAIFSDLSSALESKQLNPKSAMAADLVTIGDSWLSKAVSGGIISPIRNAEQFEWYQRLGSKWQTFVRRNEHGDIDSQGEVWGVPYRWGSLVIGYNRKKLQQHGIPPIKDWTDLWKPELAGRISMVASPREVVGVVLKALGASYNVKDFDTDVPGGTQAMEEKYLALQHQVRLFDDEQYLKTLGAGDVWVVVGWSEDVISFAKRAANISVVAPQSGTSLWADLWAIPATTKMESTKVGGRIRGPSPLVLQWFDFCLQPARNTPFENGVLAGASPITLSSQQERSQTNEDSSGDLKSFSKESDSKKKQVKKAGPNLDLDIASQLTPDVLSRCEFLEPLSDTALEDFRWLLSKRAVVERSPVGVLENTWSKFQDSIWRLLPVK